MKVSQWIRQIRLFLASSVRENRSEIFRRQSEHYEKALIGIRFFYLFSLINCFATVFNNWSDLHLLALQQPQWIFRWLPWQESKHIVIDLSIYGYFLSSLMAIFFANFRFLRILVFASLLSFVALINSDGHYSHYMHMMMYPTFMFIFLPKAPFMGRLRAVRAQVLLVFFMAQLSICIAYQMAGYSKITEIFRCLKDNGTSGCEFGGRIMTHMAAMEDIQYRWPTFAGNILYDYPVIGGVLYYGIIWIHLISLIIAFRPHLHRFFMFYRICFHFGTLIFFGIGFTPNILAMLSVFALSPFYFKTTMWQVITDLPPLHFLKACKK